MNSLRRLLYQLASLLGDLNAVSRGPGATGKRLVRKSLTKSGFKLLNRWIK